jgi:3-oxoacyl-[acyl-carrier protein] reductase
MGGAGPFLDVVVSAFSRDACTSRSKEIKMMLENKTALIYGGGGAIGGAVARAFADAGARVYLAGRSRARLEAVAKDIGDTAGVAEVDALDERAVAEHADSVAADAGGVDIALNAVSSLFQATTPFAELAVDDVMHPIDTFLRTNLITAKAVARHMTARGSGTILTLSTAASTFARTGNLGFGTTCAAIEAMTQRLALELGPSGVRAVCLRPTAIQDAPANGSYTGEQFAPLAASAGVNVEQMLAQWGQNQTLLGRLPTLAQVADTAVFLASDRAAAITGAVVDLTCGNAVRTNAGALVGLLY